MRKLFVAAAALALALAGGGVALAAPAYADSTGFTGEVDNLPVTTAATDLDFGGTLESGSHFTSILVENAGDIYPVDVADCSFTEAPSWSCDWPVDGQLETGEGPLESYIMIAQKNADGTTSTDVLTFDVYYGYYEGDDGLPTTSPYLVQDLQFRPGGVQLTSSPSSGQTNVGTTFYTLTDGEGIGWDDSGNGCPAGVDDGEHDQGPAGVAPEGQIGPQSCNVTLAAGFWGAEGDEGSYIADEDAESGYDYETSGSDTYTAFTIPTAPTVQSVKLNTDGSATITGAGGIPGQDVRVLLDGDQTKVMCLENDLDGAGWSCTTAVLAVGSYSLSVINVDVDENADAAVNDDDAYATGGESALTAAGTLVVPPPASPTSLITPVWTFTIEGDTSDIQPGDTITVEGTGLPAGTTVEIELHSTPIDLGSATVGTDGTFTKTVTIPTDAPPGDHQIIITATGAGLVPTTQAQPLTLYAVPATTTTTTPPKIKKTGDTAGLTQPIQPNILTKALTPFSEVAAHPGKISAAIEIGLVLLLLAVLPSHLLNATIAEQSDRFERRFRKLPKRPQWLTSLANWFTSAPVGAGIVVTVLTAFIFGFADPTFGFTLASLRLFLAAGIALFLVGYVANALTAAIARIQWKITVLVNTRPYGLILTIVGVLVSRLLHFSPGFLIGLILGLTIQGKSASGFAWRTVVTRTTIVLLMGIGAWIGYSTLTLGGNEGGTFGTALLVETLVAITTEGVVALLVELLPLRFLEGERVYAHSRVLWAVFYFLTLVVFVLAIVPWEGNWSALGSSLWVWLVILGAFAVVCLAVYFYFRNFAKPLEEEAGSEEVALAETVEGDRS